MAKVGRQASPLSEIPANQEKMERLEQREKMVVLQQEQMPLAPPALVAPRFPPQRAELRLLWLEKAASVAPAKWRLGPAHSVVAMAEMPQLVVAAIREAEGFLENTTTLPMSSSVAEAVPAV